MNRSLITRRPRRHLSPLPSLFGDNWGDFDRLFESFWAPSTTRTDAVAAFQPRVDVAEDEAAYVIHAELPGFSEDQVEITIADERCSLSKTRSSRSKPTPERSNGVRS